MGKTVLIVEDDNNIAELLRLYLEKEGYATRWRQMAARAWNSSGSTIPTLYCWM